MTSFWRAPILRDPPPIRRATVCRRGWASLCIIDGVYLNQISLAGRVIVVSGAGGGGIGTATCEAVAEAGADVVAIDVDGGALAEPSGRVKAHGRRCVELIADVSDSGAVSAAIQTALGEFPALHGLVNVVGGAATPHWHPVLEYPPERFDEVVTLNVKTAFLVSQAVARAMVERGTPGSIVSLASVSAAAGSPFHVPYGIAKAGIRQMSQTMAIELGSHGIRVNAIAPGTIQTPRAVADEDPERDRAAVPLGRRGLPAEIASVALFLLSDLASYITGQTLTVDGGATAKLAFLGADNAPVFVGDAIRQQLGLLR